MAGEHAVIFEQDLRIPSDAFTREGFEDWVASDSFPETGRIDFLAGGVEVERSPEDLYTHGVVKTAVVLTLGDLVVRTDRGDVFTDSTRVTSRFAQLSAEPDVVVVFRETLESGRVRLLPSLSREADRYVAIEGAPELIVEVVSDGSQKKDTERLPPSMREPASLRCGSPMPAGWRSALRSSLWMPLWMGAPTGPFLPTRTVGPPHPAWAARSA